MYGIIVSPTGKLDIRQDSAGSGSFHAPRGGRLHEGVDFVCTAGQEIYAPISGKIKRVAYPYASDLRWTGCVIESLNVKIMMFYMKLARNMVGKNVARGDIIGKAQAISNKYPDSGMIDHVHMQVEWINPQVLL